MSPEQQPQLHPELSALAVARLGVMVAEARPDIEASENSLEMNRVIERAPQAPEPAEAPIHRPRRHNV